MVTITILAGLLLAGGAGSGGPAVDVDDIAAYQREAV